MELCNSTAYLEDITPGIEFADTIMASMPDPDPAAQKIALCQNLVELQQGVEKPDHSLYNQIIADTISEGDAHFQTVIDCAKVAPDAINSKHHENLVNIAYLNDDMDLFKKMIYQVGMVGGCKRIEAEMIRLIEQVANPSTFIDAAMKVTQSYASADEYQSIKIDIARANISNGNYLTGLGQFVENIIDLMVETYNSFFGSDQPKQSAADEQGLSTESNLELSGAADRATKEPGVESTSAMSAQAESDNSQNLAASQVTSVESAMGRAMPQRPDFAQATAPTPVGEPELEADRTMGMGSGGGAGAGG
jgi:hypothetical protein